MTEKCRILRISELNGCLLRSVNQSQNLLGTTVQICKTFQNCFRSVVLIDFLDKKNYNS